MFHADEMTSLFQPEARAQIAGHDPGPTRSGLARAGGDWLAAAQYNDINRYLPLDILTRSIGDDGAFIEAAAEAHHKLVEFGPPSRPVPAQDGQRNTFSRKDARESFPTRSSTVRSRVCGPLAGVPRQLAGFSSDILLSGTCRNRGIFFD